MFFKHVLMGSSPIYLIYIDDKTTSLLPRKRMLEIFLSGGKMKNSHANLDIEKLKSFDRKYKAKLTNNR